MPETFRAALQKVYMTLQMVTPKSVQCNRETVEPRGTKSNQRQKQQKIQREWKTKSANARSNAKISAKTREANAKAILDNQGHPEKVWDEDTLKRLATEIVETIVNKCGPDGFVHVFVVRGPAKI